MAGKTIATSTTIGVSLSASSDLPLSITSTGAIASATGNAVYGAFGVFAQIVNSGVLSSSIRDAVYLQGGGSVSNSGSIESATGNAVTFKASGTLTNSGTVSGNSSGVYTFGAGMITNTGAIIGTNNTGMFLRGGGSVTNGSTSHTAAAITGANNGVQFGIRGPGTLTNFGTVASTGATTGDGVSSDGAGTIVNGTTTDTAALIGGYSAGIFLGGAGSVVTNFARITASGTSTQIGASSVGVYLESAGSITNGSATDGTALISGFIFGAEIGHGTGVIDNYGTIEQSSTLGRGGVVLNGGGTLVNGGSADTAAYIGSAGRNGVYVGGIVAGTVTNFGTIKGARNGVSMNTGGTVVNGSATDTKATISGGRQGVYIEGDLPSRVINAGTITDTGSQWGVFLYLGGSVANGSATNTAALISGAGGVYTGGPATITNFGKIKATSRAGVQFSGGTLTNQGLIASTSSDAVSVSDAAGVVINSGTILASQARGVFLDAGGTLVNGTTADAKATITGNRHALYANAAATVTNYGTLSSSIYSAVLLYRDGGSVTNFASGQITGPTGIYTSGATATVTNLGTITAAKYTGVDLDDGGTITNQSTGRIVGATGISGQGAPSTITNLGTVIATGTVVGVSGAAVALGSSGTVTNGSTTDTTATLSGALVAIYANTGAVATITNFATLSSTTDGAVFLKSNGVVSNEAGGRINGPIGVYGKGAGTKITNLGRITGTVAGVSIDAGTAAITNSGLISGGKGVTLTAPASVTLTNAGTIASTAGATGSAFASAVGGNRVIVDPGAVFIGTVNGGVGGSELELAAGTKSGTIGGIGSIGGQFSNFPTLHEDTGATWTLTGSNSVGTLTDDGSLTASGSLDVSTSLDPASTGTIDIGASASVTVGSVFGKGPAISFLGAGELVVHAPGSFGLHVGGTSYVGPLIEHFGTADSVDLGGIAPAMPGITLDLNYSASTGLLTITSPSAGAPPLASLQFQASTLGTGTFHLHSDELGGMMLTHS